MGSNRWLRNSFVYLMIIIGVIVIFYTLMPIGSSDERPVSEVIALAKNNQLEKIEVNGDKLTVHPIGKETFKSKLEKGDSITSLLLESGVEIGGSNLAIYSKGSSGLSSFFGLLLNFLPPYLLRRADPVYDAPGSGQQQPDPELWPQPGADDGLQPPRRDLRRRGRGGGSEDRTPGNCRIPQVPGAVPVAGRPHTQGRAAGGAARHRQDAAGPRRGR